MTLNWFKSKKQIEKEELELENAKLLKQTLELQIVKNQTEAILAKDLVAEKRPSIIKPYLNIKMTNSILTIVLTDGTIISKSNATKEDFEKARLAVTEEQLFNIAIPEEEVVKRKELEKEERRVKALLEGMSSLPATDFLQKEDAVYMIDNNGNTIERSIPQLLVEKFIEITGSVSFHKDLVEYQSLRKFWLKCCLNPNAKSAEDLYIFLANHKFKIDKHGNFYAYRRVVSKASQDKELVDFISNAYNKVKAVWKKKPSDFWVHVDEYENFTVNKDQYSEHNDLGNLQDLYLDLPNMKENTYTSAHTGKEDYKIGEIIAMPRNDGDDNNQISCSKGFHAASKAYDYSGFGDTPILVIINPMDVLAVPLGEVGKLRTCRWFFAMTLPEDEKYILDDDDFDVTELGDVFEEKCLNNLQEYVQNSYAEEVKRHTFTMPTISAKEVSSIVKSLEDMKQAISERVKIVLD